LASKLGALKLGALKLGIKAWHHGRQLLNIPLNLVACKSFMAHKFGMEACNKKSLEEIAKSPEYLKHRQNGKHL